MVLVWGVVLAAPRTGFCRVDSIEYIVCSFVLMLVLSNFFLLPRFNASGRWAAKRGSQRRTALRTRRSIAASRQTSWLRGRRCVQWADWRAADPAHRNKCATRQHPLR